MPTTKTQKNQVPTKLNLVHLAVYQQLMEWRRTMYDEQKNEDNSVMGVAGEAWHWASLTPGDLKFIAGEAEKINSLGVKEKAAPKPKVNLEKALTV